MKCTHHQGPTRILRKVGANHMEIPHNDNLRVIYNILVIILLQSGSITCSGFFNSCIISYKKDRWKDGKGHAFIMFVLPPLFQPLQHTKPLGMMQPVRQHVRGLQPCNS